MKRDEKVIIVLGNVLFMLAVLWMAVTVAKHLTHQEAHLIGAVSLLLLSRAIPIVWFVVHNK